MATPTPLAFPNAAPNTEPATLPKSALTIAVPRGMARGSRSPAASVAQLPPSKDGFSGREIEAESKFTVPEISEPSGPPRGTSPPEANQSEVAGVFRFLRELETRKKLLLLCLGLTDMMAYINISLLAPFFPFEAESKGLSESVVGWIFGVASFVEFLTPPLWSLVLPRVGCRFLYLSALFFSSGCTIIFGFLDKTAARDGGVMFAVLCLVVRASQAMGMSAYITASYAILSVEFRENLSFAFAVLETFVGVGFMLGPTIGGLLYSTPLPPALEWLEGYTFPFLLLGLALMLFVVLNYFLMPIDSDSEGSGYRPSPETITSPLMDGNESLELSHNNGEDAKRAQRAAIADSKLGANGAADLHERAANGAPAAGAEAEATRTSAQSGGEMMTFLRLVCIPWILVLALCTAFAMAGFAVLDPTLEPRLREHEHLSHLVISLFFLLQAACYAVFSVIVGLLATKFPGYVLMAVGFTLSTIAMFLLAPARFLGFPSGHNELWLTALALALQGVGGAFAIVPSMELMLQVSLIHDLENGLVLYAAVSGLWSSMSALGEFLGPVIAGALVEAWDFQTCMELVGIAYCAFTVVLLVAMAVSRCAPLRFREEAAAKEEEEAESDGGAGGSDRCSPTQTALSTRRSTSTAAAAAAHEHYEQPARDRGSEREAELLVGAAPTGPRGRTPRGYGTITTRGSLQAPDNDMEAVGRRASRSRVRTYSRSHLTIPFGRPLSITPMDRGHFKPLPRRSRRQLYRSVNTGRGHSSDGMPRSVSCGPGSMPSDSGERALSPNTLLEEGFVPSVYAHQHDDFVSLEASDRVGGARSLPVFSGSSRFDSETDTEREAEAESRASGGGTDEAKRQVAEREPLRGDDAHRATKRDTHN